MNDMQVDVSQLRCHNSSLGVRANELALISQNMSEKSVGSFSMYGLLVGPLTYPILKLVGHGGESSIKNLSELANAMANNLDATATDYETTETENAAIAQQIRSMLDAK